MSKKNELSGLIKKRSETIKGDNVVKRDFIANSSMDSITASNSTIPKSNGIPSSSESDKLETYRALARKKAQKPTAPDLRRQQNVYIDINLIKAIEGILAEHGQLQKKDIYNDALKMYLEFAFDMKVKLKEDEYS